MPAVVVDTHAIVWYLQASPRLSVAALTAMRTAIQNGDPVYVSSISLVEIAYLCEKGRLPADTIDHVFKILRRPGTGVFPLDFNRAMAETLRLIPAAIIPDMPDRMLAASALQLNISLVTADRKIRSGPLATIW